MLLFELNLMLKECLSLASRNILLPIEYSLRFNSIQFMENNHAYARIFSMFHYLVATYPIDIIAVDFNYDLLRVLEN